uniref:RING-type E3 ubiquitin transferase n=1 Tax=Eptatretus burgeri TaxID=7764 RepID=A0A8C4NAX8_EPTBU
CSRGRRVRVMQEDAWVVGSRVVRGPDWQWAKQDGGKGRLGTVRAFERTGQVRVVWDNGNIENYRCADADDLRVFDSAPTGIAHSGMLCNSCRALPIVGIRWRCAECLNLDLCTACYHGDRHALRHRFYSIAQPGGRFVLQKARSKSRRLVVRGALPGARVVRGCDWQWNKQDGGQDGRGKVIEIRDWCETQPRSAVCVRWECGSENLYRMGFLGMVDVKCMHFGKGSTFYVDHCPVLGEKFGDQHPLGLQAGERVCVALELELVQMFQQGHGGWTDGMLETLDTTGTICEIDGDLDALVAYPSGNRWTLNPAILIKVNIEGDENDSQGTSHFTRDCDHDSIDTITPKLQGVKTIVNTYIQIGTQPTYLLLLYQQDGVHPRRLALQVACESGQVEVLQLLLRHGADPEAQDNDGNRAIHHAMASSRAPVTVALCLAGADINVRNQHRKTPLHQAIRRANMEVAQTLLENGAHPSLQDCEGDSPLHEAVSSGVPEAMQLLLAAGADVCLTNDNGFNALAVELLLSLSSVLGLTDLRKEDGYAALHLAALNNRIEAAKVLMEQVQKQGNGLCRKSNEMMMVFTLHKLSQKSSLLSLLPCPSSLPVSGLTVAADGQLEECLVCSGGRPDTIFVPCGHAVACKDCATRIRHCLLCRKPVQERNYLYECVICAEGLATVVFEPCGHVCVCISACLVETPFLDGVRAEILPVDDCPVDRALRATQTMCPVCLDRTKNMVFMCGHSTCQRCSDRVTECPICRKRIRGRVLLY